VSSLFVPDKLQNMSVQGQIKSWECFITFSSESFISLAPI